MTRIILQEGKVIEDPEENVRLMGDLISKRLYEFNDGQAMDELEAPAFTEETFRQYMTAVLSAKQNAYIGDPKLDPLRSFFSDFSNESLYEFCHRALFYDHQRLRDLTAYLLGQRCENLTVDELRVLFHEPDDLTPAEKATIMKENEWVLKMYKSS